MVVGAPFGSVLAEPDHITGPRVPAVETSRVEASRAKAWQATNLDGRPYAETAMQARFVEALEAERARIARELHDVVGQALTMVRLHLLSLDGVESGIEPRGDEISSSLAAVDDALRQVRTAAFDLRPSILEDLGLAAALRSLCREVARRSGIAISCRISVDDASLTPEVETTCFRIAQEAIMNVVRHANAQHISVRARMRPQTGILVLEVRDDGIGIDPKHGSAMQWIGIAGMAERASFVGGTVAIRSRAGVGTHVIARLGVGPLARLDA